MKRRNPTWAEIRRLKDETMTPTLQIMDAETYHADPCEEPSYSNSIGKVLVQQSPLHAWTEHPRLNPNYQPYDDSKFDIGTAAHDLLLCRSTAKLCVIDADDWRKKETRQQRDEARDNGLIPLLRKHEYAVRKMVEKAMVAIDGSEWRGIFEAGDAEGVIVWRERGVLCRSRLDWLTSDRLVIFDYKTTENANAEAWVRGHLSPLGYDMQAELYPRAVGAAFNTKPIFVFGVQETSAPYEMSFVTLGESSRQLAEAKNNFAINLWARCLKANQWPGYSRATCVAEPKAYELEEMAMGRWHDLAPVKQQSEEDAQASMFTLSGGK